MLVEARDRPGGRAYVFEKEGAGSSFDYGNHKESLARQIAALDPADVAR